MFAKKLKSSLNVFIGFPKCYLRIAYAFKKNMLNYRRNKKMKRQIRNVIRKCNDC